MAPLRTIRVTAGAHVRRSTGTSTATPNYCPAVLATWDPPQAFEHFAWESCRRSRTGSVVGRATKRTPPSPRRRRRARRSGRHLLDEVGRLIAGYRLGTACARVGRRALRPAHGEMRSVLTCCGSDRLRSALIKRRPAEAPGRPTQTLRSIGPVPCTRGNMDLFQALVAHISERSSRSAQPSPSHYRRWAQGADMRTALRHREDRARDQHPAGDCPGITGVGLLPCGPRPDERRTTGWASPSCLYALRSLSIFVQTKRLEPRSGDPPPLALCLVRHRQLPPALLAASRPSSRAACS